MEYLKSTYSIHCQLGSLAHSGGTIAVAGSAAHRVTCVQVEVARGTGVTAWSHHIILKDSTRN